MPAPSWISGGPGLISAAPASIVLLVTIVPASAGDTARLTPLGFGSGDTTFAWIQEGFHDGSGLPYAEVHGIRLEATEPLPGLPIRQRAPDDAMMDLEQSGEWESALADLRTEVLEMADEPLERAAISGTDGGVLVASRGLYEDPADALSFVAVPPMRTGTAIQPDAAWRYTISAKATPTGSTDDCFDQGEAHRLTLTLTGGDGRETIEVTLFDEESVPADRGCPLDYALHKIIAPSEPFGQDVALVVMVLMLKPGFEGPDMRGFAVGVVADEIRFY